MSSLPRTSSGSVKFADTFPVSSSPDLYVASSRSNRISKFEQPILEREPHLPPKYSALRAKYSRLRRGAYANNFFTASGDLSNRYRPGRAYFSRNGAFISEPVVSVSNLRSSREGIANSYVTSLLLDATSLLVISPLRSSPDGSRAHGEYLSLIMRERDSSFRCTSDSEVIHETMLHFELGLGVRQLCEQIFPSI